MKLHERFLSYPTYSLFNNNRLIRVWSGCGHKVTDIATLFVYAEEICRSVIFVERMFNEVCTCMRSNVFQSSVLNDERCQTNKSKQTVGDYLRECHMRYNHTSSDGEFGKSDCLLCVQAKESIITYQSLQVWQLRWAYDYYERRASAFLPCLSSFFILSVSEMPVFLFSPCFFFCLWSFNSLQEQANTFHCLFREYIYAPTYTSKQATKSSCRF